MTRQQVLSKSKFQSGKQCELKLWRDTHDRSNATEHSASQMLIFEQGTEVGNLAMRLWPDGRLVDAKFYQHDEAVADTEQMIHDPDTMVIFEAGFLELDVRVRADVLVRVGDTGMWDLIEVKSSTNLDDKDHYITDVAIQAEVIEAAGIKLRYKSILLIDNSYVYQGGELDLESLFKLEDRTDQVTERQMGIRTEVEELHGVLQLADEPDISPDARCLKPYKCDYYAYCTRNKPEHWVTQLPRLTQSPKRVAALRDAGIEDISKIPEKFSLSTMQQRVREGVISGDQWISKDLPAALSILEAPVHFLDFESFNPAVPIYAGMRPYQQILFQWSCHIDRGNGLLEHLEFLSDGLSDPRRELIESLIEAVGDTGTILMYGHFERDKINELAQDFPEYADALGAIVIRLEDLSTIIGKHVYDPEFHGSFSLKSVLPTLVPELAYDDLDIQAGDAASVMFRNVAMNPDRPGIDPELASQLKAYCGRDTEGMVRILEYLMSAA